MKRIILTNNSRELSEEMSGIEIGEILLNNYLNLFDISLKDERNKLFNKSLIINIEILLQLLNKRYEEQYKKNS